MEELYTIYCKNIIIQEKKELLLKIPYFAALFDNGWKQTEDNELDLNFETIDSLSVLKVIKYFKNENIRFEINDFETLKILGIDINEEKEIVINDNIDLELIKTRVKEFDTFESPHLDITVYNTPDNIELNRIYEAEVLHKMTRTCEIKYKKHYERFFMDNANTRVEIGRYGDIIDSFTLFIKLPALSDGLYWKNKVGLELIKEIKVTSVGNTIIKYPKEILEFQSISHKSDFDLFDYPLELRKLLSKNEYICKITLKLFDIIPLIAMTFDNLKIEIEYNYNVIENYNQDINKNDINVMLCSVYGMLIDSQKRQDLASNKHQQLILSTNKLNVEKKNNSYIIYTNHHFLGVYDIIIKTNKILKLSDIESINIKDHNNHNTLVNISVDLLKIYENFIQIKPQKDLNVFNSVDIYIEFKEDIEIIVYSRLFNQLSYSNGVIGAVYV